MERCCFAKEPAPHSSPRHFFTAIISSGGMMRRDPALPLRPRAGSQSRAARDRIVLSWLHPAGVDVRMSIVAFQYTRT
jgi:hypothetical protein